MPLSPRKVEILVKENITSKEDTLTSELKNEVEIKEDNLSNECEPEKTESFVNNFNIDIQKAKELKDSIKEPIWGEFDNHKITDDDGFSLVNKNRRGGKKEFMD